jgi:hypothetical protein
MDLKIDFLTVDLLQGRVEGTELAVNKFVL